LIYFGENKEYILCECETCKGEMYIEKNNIADEDAYSYHLYVPIKCRCGSVDEYISRAKKSCHRIKHELFALSDLLHKQQNVSGKISEITSELNKKFEPPSFLQSVGKDLLFAVKVFLILLGAVIGVEIFLFIITALMFFFGIAFQAPDIAANGNELFYNINIFKERGGNFLSSFGWDAAVKPLNEYGADPSEGLIFGYIPAAIIGIIIIVFYIFLIVLLVRVAIDVARLTLFASKVMNQKIKINQKREEYQKQLSDLSVIYQNLGDQINEFTVIPNDYKNIRAADSILRYFINNRIDTVKEALNLYHEEDFKNKMLEYSKALYNESKQTRRYTKALYMMTSDENIKVDIKEPKEDTSGSESENAQIGEMLKGAFSKIKKPQQNLKKSKKVARIPPPSVTNRVNDKISEDKKEKNIPETPDISSVTSNPDQDFDFENPVESDAERDELDELLTQNSEKNETDEVNELNDNDEETESEFDEFGELQGIFENINIPDMPENIESIESIEDIENIEEPKETNKNDKVDEMSAVFDGVPMDE